MKARVKATGEIVNIYEWSKVVVEERCKEYPLDELELVEGKTNYTSDYWEKLLHQYAGMAMQGLMSYVEQITPKKGRSFCDEIVDISFNVAHALVEKLKKESK